MIAAVGAFDGYHIGHRSLLESAAAIASEIDGSWGVVTFAREDGKVLGIKGVRALFAPHEQEIIERLFGIPIIHKINFTQDIMNMSPHDFLGFIGEKYQVRGVVVGSDFRFGKGREGSADFVLRECEERGWRSQVMPLVEISPGVPVCSTAIRSALSDGDVELASTMLGHPYFCVSRVVHGAKRGRTLGFPTANIKMHPDKADIRDGVYAVIVRLSGEWRTGCMNIGRNPTFEDVDDRRIEVFIDGFDGDLYGRELPVFILKRIRDERKFDSAEALAAQISSDASEIRSVCRDDMQVRRTLWRKLEPILDGTVL